MDGKRITDVKDEYANKMPVATPEGKKSLSEDLRVYGVIILNAFERNQTGCQDKNWINLARVRPMVGCCEHGNECLE